VSLPSLEKSMHYLNNFRKNPAISKLDWHFTTNQNSSQFIATNTSSAY